MANELHRAVAEVNGARGEDEPLLEIFLQNQMVPAPPGVTGRSTRARRSTVQGSLRERGSESDEVRGKERGGEDSDDLDVPLR